MQKVNCVLLALYPTEEFLKWLNNLSSKAKILTFKLENASVDKLADDSLVYLIQKRDSVSAYEKFFAENYADFFKSVLASWCSIEKWWPQNLSYDQFKSWFRLELHNQVFVANKELAL